MKAVKFGGKQTMRDKVAVATSRVGKNPGVSKGAAKPPKAKVEVKPVGGIKNLTRGPQGAKITYTKKF